MIRNVDDFYQILVVHNDKTVPTELIGFNYVLTAKDFDCGVHFFVDDYQFERLWNQPNKYVNRLKQFHVVLSPDFSLYIDMPMAMKVWKTYRSRLLGNYWQRCGIKVLPTINWAEKETFDFCFDGIPEGSIVSVSTIGVKRENEAFQIWKDSMDAMIDHIKPKTILIYGGKLEYDYPEDCEVIYFENKVTKRMKNMKE